MKIQELAIIFIIIILPISLLLSEYTQFQIQTIALQSEYDARLTAATYDAIRAFQLNATNSSTSDLANSKMRDLEASIATFRNSIMTGFELNGYTEEDLNNYIPALVYTLYDGFYIYSPYENTHDESGNRIPGGGDSIYGLKPYINYSCRYKSDNGKIDVVITYALDNNITVQGMMPDETGNIVYVNKSGYLIDGITVNGDTVTYNGVNIQNEHLKESLLGRECSYAKINGTKYYLVKGYTEDGKDCIVYILNGKLIVQYNESDTEFSMWKNKILNNDNAKQYYIKAYEFTKWLREETDLDTLTYANTIDEVIDNDGSTKITKVWGDNNTKIFDFKSGINIENELSDFNQHRLAVIRHKIETNLAIAISNYNSYSGATSNVFQMPELKENEWDNITHSISLISFLQGLHIGGKVYNGYTLVTNSESKEVVIEDNIYILAQDAAGKKAYHKIGDKGFENGTLSVNASQYGDVQSAGRLNLDFEKASVSNNNLAYSYYPLEGYKASYSSVVMQNSVTTYDDIYEYVNTQDDTLKEAFYTALGRERVGKYNIRFNNNDVTENNVATSGLIRYFEAENNTGSGHSNLTTTWKDLSENKDGILSGGIWGDKYLSLDGVDDWVNLGQVDIGGEVTVEITVVLHEVGKKVYLISNYQNGGVGIEVSAKGIPGFAVWNASTSSYVQTPSSGLQSLTAGQKYHLLGVFDGNSVKLYVNGSLYSQIEFSGVYGAPDNDTVMALGVNPKGSTFQGTFTKMNVYSARVYDISLTDEEIKQNFKESKK